MARVGAALLVAGLHLMTVGEAAGHGSAYLQVEPSSMVQGDTIAVRGAGFGDGVEVRLVLVEQTAEVELAQVVGDIDGAFEVQLLVPDATTPGTHRLEARGDAHTESADLIVLEAASRGGEAEPGREEEDALLVPLPSNWGEDGTTARQAPAVSTQTQDPPEAAPNPSPILGDAVFVAAVVSVAVVTLAMGIARLRR